MKSIEDRIREHQKARNSALGLLQHAADGHSACKLLGIAKEHDDEVRRLQAEPETTQPNEFASEDATFVDFTPGPWKIEPTTHMNGEPTAEIQHGNIGEVVCTMDSYTPGVDQVDARLIAAAPEMFELLRKLRNAVDALDECSDCQDEIDETDALLTRIKGGDA